MRLTDIMSHMDLAMFPKVALVIFLSVFVAVMLKLYLTRGGSAEFARCAALPLDDAATTHRDPDDGVSHTLPQQVQGPSNG